MAKDLTKKMNEIMDVFMDLSQNNPVLNEIQEMSSKIGDMVKSLSEKKFNFTESFYESINESFEKYKNQVKTINRQKDLLKETMKKMKDLYQDEISKKIKEVENFKMTQDSFDLARQTFKQYQETVDALNRQSDIFVEALKDFKETIQSQKDKKERPVKKNPVAKTAE